MKKNSCLKVVLLFFLLGLVSGCASRSAYIRMDPSLKSDLKNIGGYQYLPLTRLCDAYGLDCRSDAVTRTATVTTRSYKIVLRAGSDNMLVNGAACRMDRPAVLSGGAIFVPVSFARSYIWPFAGRTSYAQAPEPAPEKASPKKFSINTIVLDSGHGGKDVGAIGSAYGTKEKEMALKFAKKVKSMLESRGLRVVLTRSDDTFISLERRADIANSSNADLFVSIHINASRSRSLRGFECYCLSEATDDNARALEAFEDSSLKLSDSADAEHSTRLDKTLWDMALTENRTESRELACYICKSVDESLLIKNRGVRTARFYVLKHTHIPSVLVEVGYLSNRHEEAEIRDPKFIDRMAEAIARGILRYKERYEETEAFTDV